MFVTAFRRKRGAKTDDTFPWTVPALRALDDVETPYDELEHVRITRDFLNAPGRYLRYLMRAPERGEGER